MKTNRILGLTAVVCTLLAGGALALDATDFSVIDFPPPVTQDLVGVDALADGSVVVYDGESVFVRGAEEGDAFDAGTALYANTGENAVGSEGFVAADPNGGALIGAADGAMWLLDGSELVVTDGPTDGVVFGEFVDATSVLVSSGTELGLVTWNSGELTASYTAVVDYNTSSMAPAGIVCIDDKVYVGDASGTIRSFKVADLKAVTDTPLEAADGAAFATAPNFAGKDGYGVFGPTSATPDGNLLVGGVGTIEVVQPGGFLRRAGRVFESVDFGTELLYLPISVSVDGVDGKILVADSDGGAQEAVADVDPGFFGKLFAPIVQLFQWLFGLIAGLFGFGA